MNTESINTLKLIREAINEVQKALNDPELTTSQRKNLERVLIRLFEMDEIIINDSLQGMIDKLNSSNEDLKILIGEMDASVAKLAQLAARISRISTVVGTLTDIVGKAMAVGIL